MKNLIYVLFCVLALTSADTTVVPFASPLASTSPSPSPSTSVSPNPSTSLSPSPSTSLSPNSSTSLSPNSSTSLSPNSSTSLSPSPSTSLSPNSSASLSPSPSTSLLPSPSTSLSPNSSASVSPNSSASVSPNSSSSVSPVSSRIITTQPPKPKYHTRQTFTNPETGKPCIWFNASIDIIVKGKNTTETISLDNNVLNVNGVCSNFTAMDNKSMISLKWKNHSFTAVFSSSEDGKSWYFSEIGVNVDVNESYDIMDLSNGQVTAKKTYKDGDNSQYLRAEHNRAYSCDQKEAVLLKSSNSSLYNVTLHIMHLEVQPFENGGIPTADFDSCSSKSNSSKSSSIVPIAVGCALAGLIVIVLIAYLIGRRRNDGRGYQQV